MRIACLAYSSVGVRLAVPSSDQHYCQGFQDRSWATARSDPAVRSSRTRCKQNRQTLPALPRCRLGHDKHQSTRPTQSRQAVGLCPHAFRYDLVNPPEPSSKPAVVCKRWLQSIFPFLRNEELVAKVLWTLMVIAIARLGQQLKLPYVDVNLAPLGGVANTVEALMGGSTHNPYNIFMLGIGPIINASISASLLANLGEKGAWGRRLQNQVLSWKSTGNEGQARFLGVMDMMALGFAVSSGALQGTKLLPCVRPGSNVPFVTLITVMLTAGAAVLRWLAQSIETRGIGDGTSVIIVLSIVTNYASVLKRILLSLSLGSVTGGSLVRIGVGYMGLVFLAVLISSLSLRFPLIYYKQRRSKAPEASVKKRQAAAAALGSKGSTPDTAYLPIRLSANGMSAVLYASFLYSLPDLIGCFSFKAQLWTTKVLIKSRWFPLWYGVFVFGCGLVHFGDASPKNMSNYLTAVEAGIQGVSPGPSTEKYLRRKVQAVRIWGAFSVAVLAVMAQCFDMYCIEKIGMSINSTSLLLVVGLITSCIRQVQSLMQLPRLEQALQRERSVLQRMSSVKSPS